MRALARYLVSAVALSAAMAGSGQAQETYPRIEITGRLQQQFYWFGNDDYEADVGPGSNLFTRRARFEASGDIAENVSFKIQPSFEGGRTSGVRLRDAYIDVRLTAKDAPADQVQGLERGADDYVVKPFTFEVLVARVRVLLRRSEADRPDVFRFLDLSLDTGTRLAHRGEREIALTTTEYDLLHQLLEHPRRVLPRDFLMERVWGYDFGGNANILEVYVKQLRQKLEAEGESRLIHTLRGTGYVLREP